MSSQKSRLFSTIMSLIAIAQVQGWIKLTAEQLDCLEVLFGKSKTQEVRSLANGELGK